MFAVFVLHPAAARVCGCNKRRRVAAAADDDDDDDDDAAAAAASDVKSCKFWVVNPEIQAPPL